MPSLVSKHLAAESSEIEGSDNHILYSIMFPGRLGAMEQRPSENRPAKSSSKRVAPAVGKRSVKFNDNVDTLLITSRLERLRKEIEDDERDQEQRRVVMKSSYGGHLDFLNKERKRIEREVNQLSKVGI